MRACFVLRTDLFHPSPVFRALKEIRALQEAGVECSAVCWIKEITDLPAEEAIEGIRVIRIFRKPPAQRLSNLWQRYRELRSVTLELKVRLTSLQPNIVIAHDLEVLAAGVAAAQAVHARVLFDAHEDWPAMVGETSRIEGWLASFLERRLSRQVDATVTPSDSIRDKYRGRGLRAETLYNSPYRDEVDSLSDATTVERTRRELGMSGRFVLGYSGTLAPYRGLETTIDALALLPNDVVFLVVGGPDGERRRLEGVARERSVSDKIRFVGQVLRADVPRFVAAFDLALVLLPPVSANYLQALPNKVFDYMAAGIPVLTSDLPELRRLVEVDARCGVAVRPDPSSVAAAVTSLRATPGPLKQLGANGRTAFVERFSWDHQAEQFLSLLRETGVPMEVSVARR